MKAPTETPQIFIAARLHFAQLCEEMWFDPNEWLVGVRPESSLYGIVTRDWRVIKFGMTRDLTGRFQDLSNANSESLVLVGAIPEYCAPEKLVHRVFKELREHGEWFTVCPRITRWLATWPVSATMLKKIARGNVLDAIQKTPTTSHTVRA